MCRTRTCTPFPPVLPACLHPLAPPPLPPDATAHPSAPLPPLPPPPPPAGTVLLLRELDRQARQEGGAVYMLNGNHESLNVAGDFRWVARVVGEQGALPQPLPPLLGAPWACRCWGQVPPPV